MDNNNIIGKVIEGFEPDIRSIEFNKTELDGEVDFSYLKKFIHLKKVIITDNKKLTGIVGLPDSIEKIVCKNNLLKSFNDLPSSLKVLDCENNKLDTPLDNLPKGLKVLICSNNSIKLFENLPNELVCLVCQKNKITNLENLPESLEMLDCSYNEMIINLSNLPANLKILHCNGIPLNNLNNLPVSLTDLSCVNCDLISINLPCNLIGLDASINKIKKLDSFPPNMEHIDLSDNPKIKISNLPSSLLNLDVTDCELTKLPILNDGIRYCYVSCNSISSIDGKQLPQSLLYFDCTDNKFTKICNLTKQTLKSIFYDKSIFDNVKFILESGEEVDSNKTYSEYLDLCNKYSYDNLNINYVISKYQKLFYETDEEDYG